jgi:hypothetical protein
MKLVFVEPPARAVFTGLVKGARAATTATARR